MRSIPAEYRAGTPEAMAFFAGSPASLMQAPPKCRAWGAEFTDAVNGYNEGIGASGRCRGEEAVIITGQQPGLFSGPLYSVYKAISAIKVAATLEAKHGVPCVPIYWVGSEDHDLAEAASAHFLTANHSILSLEYKPAAPVDGFPMHRVPIEPSLHGFVDRAAEECGGTEFSGEVARFLHGTLDASVSLADWSARLLARIFRDTPLLFYAPHIEAGRRAAAPIVRREIEDPLRSTRALNDAGRALEAAGFPPQVVKGPTECNFFLMVGDRRRKILYENDQFVVPEEETRYSKEQLLALLAEASERFSPNVALRCVTQQQLFPAAAYVAGPGELAYWAQLKPVFAMFDQPMPIVYPRAHATLTTMKLEKIRRKIGFELDELAGLPNGLLDRALHAAGANPSIETVRSRRETIRAQLAEMTSAFGKDKTGQAMATALEREVGAGFDRLERSLLYGDNAKVETIRKQVDRLCNSLMPLRKPQERVFNIFPFLFEHGWDLIPRLIESIDAEPFATNVVEL